MSSGMTQATLVAETVFLFPGGSREAIRVIIHDDAGNKPRGKEGKGTLLVAKEGETHSDLLRSAAGYLEQEGSWEAFKNVYSMVEE